MTGSYRPFASVAMMIAKETGWPLERICALTHPQLEGLLGDWDSPAQESARRQKALADSMEAENRRRGLPAGLTPQQKKKLVRLMQDGK
jgi:hypothetical protein